MILAGDIGGTRARFALFENDGSTLLHEAVLESRRSASAIDAIDLFFKGAAAVGLERVTPDGVALGIAGPVVDGACHATNLPWTVSEAEIATRFQLKKVRLLNDLEAIGHGVLSLEASSLVSIQAGLPKRSGKNMAVIAAGTGLGEAALVWDGARYRPIATEGGHCDFAPRDTIERDLSRFLEERYDHVSYERVISGMGIGHIYDYFCDHGGHEPPELADQILHAKDRNATIAAFGQSGESEIAARTLDLFVSLYGAEAGNLVLKTLALDGVYVVGNIARSLIDRMTDGSFSNALIAKGRMMDLLRSVPVAVVMAPDVGIRGSARIAAEMARD